MKSDLVVEAAALLTESAEVKRCAAEKCAEDIAAAARLIIGAYESGCKLIAFGNGGSAADAQHFTAELVGRYLADRPALPAICLSDNASTVTSVSNDYGFELLFARQIEAHCRPGDVVVGITTSGTSPNVVAGLKKARELGARTIGLTGRSGGGMPALCDACVIVPHNNTARIQEVHITIIHIWCTMLEAALWGKL
ncbi:phosphoheptose isomerase [candidate division BRC1 bacterium HGW-BRC1-1]|nr:MAG: phosphoheptose isomerase [candidate division BRC1 bacterium HGW-BRC1-1]